MINRAIAIFILITGIASCTRSICLKNKITLGERYYFTCNDSGSYFVFSDTGQIEYQNGHLFSQSKIHWYDCSSYALIISQIVDTSNLKVTDTINFVLHSFDNDTFNYTVEGKGRILDSKFFRDKKTIIIHNVRGRISNP